MQHASWEPTDEKEGGSWVFVIYTYAFLILCLLALKSSIKYSKSGKDLWEWVRGKIFVRVPELRVWNFLFSLNNFFNNSGIQIVIFEQRKLSQNKNKFNLASKNDMAHRLHHKIMWLFLFGHRKLYCIFNQLKMEFWHGFIQFEPD